MQLVHKLAAMFIVVLSTVLALMNVYAWKRLVRDTTGPGRTRRILTAVLIGLAVLLVATLVVPRFTNVSKSGWYAWPGYLWFGVVVYLFLTLLVLDLGGQPLAALLRLLEALARLFERLALPRGRLGGRRRLGARGQGGSGEGETDQQSAKRP